MTTQTTYHRRRYELEDDLAVAVATRFEADGRVAVRCYSDRYTPAGITLGTSGYNLTIRQDDPEASSWTVAIRTTNEWTIAEATITVPSITVAADMVTMLATEYAHRPSGTGTNPNTHRAYEEA